MEFIWGFVLGFFTAGLCFSQKIRAGFRAILMGLWQGLMRYRKWAIAQGAKSKAKARKTK